jgi:hypothetical protein
MGTAVEVGVAEAVPDHSLTVTVAEVAVKVEGPMAAGDGVLVIPGLEPGYGLPVVSDLLRCSAGLRRPQRDGVTLRVQQPVSGDGGLQAVIQDPAYAARSTAATSPRPAAAAPNCRCSAVR